MNPLNWRWWRNRCALKRKHRPDPDVARRAREAAFGPITPETRAEDRQRLADAVAGKADRLI